MQSNYKYFAFWMENIVRIYPKSRSAVSEMTILQSSFGLMNFTYC